MPRRAENADAPPGPERHDQRPHAIAKEVRVSCLSSFELRENSAKIFRNYRGEGVLCRGEGVFCTRIISPGKFWGGVSPPLGIPKLQHLHYTANTPEFRWGKCHHLSQRSSFPTKLSPHKGGSMVGSDRLNVPAIDNSSH